MDTERAMRLNSRLNGIELSLYGLSKEINELTEAKKEEALGPMLYEITATDLSALSSRQRQYVCKTEAAYFNEVCATRLLNHNQGFGWIGPHDIDAIMEWKRACVSRITQEQVAEAIDAQAGGN